MEIFNADRQRNLEINNLLQKIKYEANKQRAGAFIYFPIFVINGRDIEYKISPSGRTLFKELEKMGAIRLRERSCEEINKTLEEARKSKNKPLIAEGYLVRPIEPIFSQLCEEYERKSNEKLDQSKNSLKSIHLITNSLIGDRLDIVNTIFLVLDEHFEMPIRCAIKNKEGKPTYIKKLYDIAYFVDAPGKSVHYDKNLADNINNGLFRKRAIAKYRKTNKLRRKPTLVQKSENGEYLVLKNEIIVKTGLINHNVPVQYQSLYIDKTK